MILTVGTDEGLRDRVAVSVRETQWATTVTNVATVGEAEELLRSASPPRVVVVGESIGVDGAGDVAAVSASLRSPPLVLLVGRPSTTLLRQAMRAGIRDVLPTGFSAEDLVASLQEAGVAGGGPDPRPGLTVAVFSTKGGVGTSVVASNLAVLLAKRTGAATTLVDLDLASADQAIMHGLTPKWTVQDLADGTVGLDDESLEQVLCSIEGSGSRLLPGPVDPALAERITAADVGTVIGAVRAQAPIAVLDLASGFDDRTLTALDAADVTVVVSSLDVAALRALSVSLQTLERLGTDPGRVLLALVRADSKSGLVVSDIERTVDRSVDVQVPSTRTVPRSVNEGTPLAISSRRSSVVQALEGLVELLVARLPESAAQESQSPSPSRSTSGGLCSFGRARDSKPAPTSSDTGGGTAPHPPSPPQDDTSEASADGERRDDNVRPIRVRATKEAGSRRPHPGATGPTPQEPHDAVPGDEPVADDGGENPQLHAAPSLEELPPPNVLHDDDDDKPRRRRRR